MINHDYEKEKLTEKISILSIAYHNLAVELEYLNRKDESIMAYKKAISFAKKYLGDDNALTKNF